MSSFTAGGQALLRFWQMTGAGVGRVLRALVGREAQGAEPPLAGGRAAGLRDIPACLGVKPGIGGPG